MKPQTPNSKIWAFLLPLLVGLVILALPHAVAAATAIDGMGQADMVGACGADLGGIARLLPDLPGGSRPRQDAGIAL